MTDSSIYFTGLYTQRNIPLSTLTTLCVGGKADTVVYPTDTRELVYALTEGAKRGIPLLVLGNGSNTLASDSGFKGAVIVLNRYLRHIGGANDTFFVRAGAKLSDICEQARRRDVGGFEFMRSIPGCIGASIVGNAGCFGKALSDTVSRVWAIDLKALYGFFGASYYWGVDGIPRATEECRQQARPLDSEINRQAVSAALRCFTKAQLTFGYRTSVLKGGRFVVIGAELKGKGCFDEGLATEIAKAKALTQPVGYRSAGSVFLRVGDICPARLIDELGLKGFSVGGACVSQRHSGFIVNKNGNASAKDIYELIEMIKSVVYEKTGVVLTTEIACIGDGKYYPTSPNDHNN